MRFSFSAGFETIHLSGSMGQNRGAEFHSQTQAGTRVLLTHWTMPAIVNRTITVIAAKPGGHAALTQGVFLLFSVDDCQDDRWLIA
jgi:hypothetical protein